MATLQRYQFLCRQDNYGVLIHDPASGRTASIDAPEASAIETALKATGWRLSEIWCTHHHHDHTAAIPALKAAYGCAVYGPKAEADHIAGLDILLGGGDRFDFSGHRVDILDTPGHTLGHIVFTIADQKLAFTGDTLFALGCGRVIEGTMRQMWTSLSRLMALPGATGLYCGHEYTAANARFALSVDPDNESLRQRAEKIMRQRSRGELTLPTTLDLELATNPFLRVGDPSIRHHLGVASANDVEVFAELRRRKDCFAR